MLTVLFCICIYRIAEHEKRRGWLWASFTALCSVFLQLVLHLGYWGAASAVILTYAAMVLVNIKRPVNKGPFLR